MNVIIESLIFDFDNKVRETVLELINRIVLTKDEKELRETIPAYALRSDLDRYFVYGFGKHHLWLYLKNYIITTFKVKNQ